MTPDHEETSIITPALYEHELPLSWGERRDMAWTVAGWLAVLGFVLADIRLAGWLFQWVTHLGVH